MDCFAKCLPPKDKYVRQPGVRPLLPHFADPNNLRTAADMRKANPALAKRMAEKSRRSRRLQQPARQARPPVRRPTARYLTAPR